MMICLIYKKEILEADEKVFATEVRARTINESSKKRKRTDVTAVWGTVFTSFVGVLTQMHTQITDNLRPSAGYIGS